MRPASGGREELLLMSFWEYKHRPGHTVGLGDLLVTQGSHDRWMLFLHVQNNAPQDGASRLNEIMTFELRIRERYYKCLSGCRITMKMFFKASTSSRSEVNL
jgi:hypothetical protein